MRVVADVSRGTDDDRQTERERLRGHLERAQAGHFFRAPHRGDDARRARGPLRVHLDVPGAQLGLEILLVQEAALLEEAALDPADQVLDGALLLRRMRPAHLDAEAQVEHHPGEGRIPLRDLAILSPVEGDCLGAIKHGEQRNPAHGGEVIDERPGERLHLLVGNEGHLDPPRILEARRKEVDPPTRPVEEADEDTAEVVLREFPGQSFEAHHRAWRRRADRAHHLVKRTLRAPVAGELRPTEELQTHELRLVAEPRDHVLPKRRRLAGRPMPRCARARSVSACMIMGSPTTRWTLRLPTATSAAISSSVCARAPIPRAGCDEE
ncbi:MAG: hypothetical protein ACT4P7_12810 [Gemmatimonadaceae bacterium]